MRRTVVLLLLVFFTSTPILAFETIFPKEASQGSTVEVRVPASDILSVEGNLSGRTIQFYKHTTVPSDDTPISRGEFLRLMFAYSNLPKATIPTNPPFPDVDLTSASAPAISQAMQLGIVHGYEDGKFYPDNSLTRAQAAKILITAFHPESVLDQPTTFTDMPRSHSLGGFMHQAIQAGFFRGYGDGTVKPDRALTYHEAELLIQRSSGSDSLPVREAQSYFRGFVGLHRVNDSGIKTLQLTAHTTSGSISKTVTITVKKQNYPTTSFRLAPSKTALFADGAYNKTWAMIDEAKKTTNSEQLWEGAFIVPTEGEVSMGFGDVVYINGAFSGSHFGIDYANKTGTPVYASNHGIVVLSDYTPSYGNTVIIEHGQNVFTMYMHMSELKVTKDQKVKKGDLVGLIGSTGIATGPHLHFTHFIGDVIVNSEEWFQNKY